MEIDVSSAAGLMRSLQKCGGRLVVNLSGEVMGHANSELDNYARIRLSGEIPKETPCILFADPTTVLAGVIKLFGGYFELVSLDNTHKLLADYVANCHPELTVDVGHSSFKVAPPARGYLAAQIHNNKLYYRSGFLDGIYSDTLKHYQRIRATRDARPLRLEIPCPNVLREFVDRAGRPVVVLAQRQEVTSGTKIISGDEFYWPTLEYLKDSGYTMVFSGREIMPESWNKYGVINYARSSLATVVNDFHLYRLSKFGVLPASGTTALAETQCLPYVQTNTSNPAIPTYSKNSITLPSLWESKVSGNLIPLTAQIRSNLEAGIGVPQGMKARSVTAQDVLEAVQELEALIEDWKPRSPLQQQWTDIGSEFMAGRLELNGKTLLETIKKYGWVDGNDELLDGFQEDSIISIVESRVAQGFLERNQEALF